MTATDGGQAVALAKQFGPDLMVLDVTLPGLSSQTVEKARRLGAYAYLPKPFDLNRLVEHAWRGLRQTSSD
jgi:DNA-binding response OmpR family regulator